jgi:hypothetical protein
MRASVGGAGAYAEKVNIIPTVNNLPTDRPLLALRTVTYCMKWWTSAPPGLPKKNLLENSKT